MRDGSNHTFAWLFGRTRVECCGMRIDTRLPIGSIVLLVRLLISPGQTFRRDEVAFSLWPDLCEADARATLRRHLYNIQKALPHSDRPWIVCDGRSISWAPHDQTWVDVAEFESLRCDPSGMEVAATLVTGDLTPTLDHEWIETQRFDFAARAQELFQTLMERAKDANNLGSELHYCNRLLGLDPWREDLVCRSLRLRYQLGDRAGALTAFKIFQTRLQFEFGVEPMAETIYCRDSIASGLQPAM